VKTGFINISIFFIILIKSGGFAFAQETPVKKDSTHLYENIESYSKRSKFKTFIYRLIFKPVTPLIKEKKAGNAFYERLKQKPYSAFEGKIIRNIEIITLDPFGYSVTDTANRKKNSFYNAGNRLHIKSHSITIRNLLLFHRNQEFNSLLVSESERLIRSQEYVHEVAFSVVPAGNNSDSVDVFIRELDKWSIIPGGSVSTSKIRADISDVNFLGSGHGFKNTFSRNFTTGINSFNTNYFIPNIRNTYISANIHLGFDGFKNFTRSLAIDRPFYSPVAQWAAGISYSSQIKKDSLKDVNSVYVPVSLKFNTSDFWAGKAHQIFKNNAEDDFITNFVWTLRYLRISYKDKPSELIDPLHIYSSEDFYLTSLGISARKYVKDRYVFRFGITEDVPVGITYGLTGGYQLRDSLKRIYLGILGSFGNYYRWGYLSSCFEYGTFLNKAHAEQAVFKAGVNYSTELFEIGKWRFRQFVKPQVTIGKNRFPYDSLTLNDGYGIDGFNSTALSGTARMSVTCQTQSYAPWNLVGFHFGPALIFSLGMLSNEGVGFRKSKVYSQIGLGVLIKNENLVFKSFQISVSFYPSIPGIGQNVFKMNSFRTTDFGFRDFEIGKPIPVIYR